MTGLSFVRIPFSRPRPRGLGSFLHTRAAYPIQCLHTRDPYSLTHTLYPTTHAAASNGEDAASTQANSKNAEKNAAKKAEKMAKFEAKKRAEEEAKKAREAAAAEVSIALSQLYATRVHGDNF